MNPARPTKFPSLVFCLLIFCFFLNACGRRENRTAAGKQPDLLALTDKMSIINRPHMLYYADSLYNSQKTKTPLLNAGHLMAYANFYALNNLYKKSFVYTDSAIAIIDRQNLDDSIWTRYYFAAHTGKANLFFKTGAYRQAIDAYFKIKELADKPENACRIGYKLNENIGLILFRQQRYEDAKKSFKTALRQKQSCPVDKQEAYWEQLLLDNTGLCFFQLDKRDSALYYFRKVLRLTVTDSDKFSPDPLQNRITRETCKGVVLANIARVYVKENKLDSAEQLFETSIAINKRVSKNELNYAQHAQLFLADLYELRGKFPEMKDELKAMRTDLDSVHNSDVELGWRRLMAEYAAKNNLPGEELKYYKSYLHLKDSLDKAQMQASELDLAKEFQVKGQQKDIMLLEKDNQLSHIYLWITLLLSAMALMIIVLVYYYYRKGKKNIRSLKLLNREIGEQRDKLEFAIVELGKSNTEKERILKVVAHDLRDPIGGAASVVNMIINEKLPRDFEMQNLSLVEKTLGNSLALIGELLALDPGPEHLLVQAEPADINEMARQCCNLMRLIAAKKEQKIHLSALQNPLTVGLDKARIERMLNNLIGNAIKFSPAGETIDIELEQKEKCVLIVVKDHGIGIPADMQAELFKPLSGTRRSGTAGEKSFGLGLSICKQIVEAHNGKIWVDSEPGKGAAFYVELPLGNNV